MAVLENLKYKLEICEETGAITGFLNKQTGWNVVRQPKLAMGIRLLVPTDTHRNNRALSEMQKVSLITVDRDGLNACLVWDKVNCDFSGNLDIQVELSIKLEEDTVTFQSKIKNHSKWIVEEFHCPCLGGMREPEGENTLMCITTESCADMVCTRMGDGFPMELGYWGTDYPTFIRSYPDKSNFAPFELLSNGKQGLYIGMHDTEPKMVHFIHELRPGYLNSKNHTIPMEDEVGGIPAGYVVSAAQMPFIQPEESEILAPIVVSMFEGDWHAGVKTYMRFRETWHRHMPQPKWITDSDCWMTIHMNSPENCCRYRYSDLPGLAREAKENGVQVIQVIGWAIGGQDSLEPYQDTDPILGTKEELTEAVKEIEQMGIRVLLMCKFKWADQAAPGWKEELLPQTVKDMYGNYVQFGGYSYQTLAQHTSGVSRRCGGGLCHSSEAFRNLAKREFEKILSIGSSGILYDELNNHHMSLCFDRTHGHKWGEVVLNGSVKLAEQFYEMGRSRNPEFAMAGEGPRDPLSQYYPVNYIRTWDGGKAHTPIWKYIDPEMKMATCVVGWDDREIINQCIAYGYIINYEPYNFKGHLSDYPDTVAYARKAQELRYKLWEYLWEGTFVDNDGVTIQTDKNGSQIEYTVTVFVKKETHKRAIVVSNFDASSSLEGSLQLQESANEFIEYDVDDGQESIGNSVMIPPRSFKVYVEK